MLTEIIASLALSQPADCELVMPEQLACHDRVSHEIYARLGGVQWHADGSPSNEEIVQILECYACNGPANEKIYRKTITKEFCLNLGGGVKVQPGGVGWEVHTNLGWCWSDSEFFEARLCCPQNSRSRGTVLVRHQSGTLTTIIDYSAKGEYLWNKKRCPDNRFYNQVSFTRNFECGTEVRDQPYDLPVYIFMTEWLCCPETNNPLSPSPSEPSLENPNDKIDNGCGYPLNEPCDDYSSPFSGGSLGFISSIPLLVFGMSDVIDDGEDVYVSSGSESNSFYAPGVENSAVIYQEAADLFELGLYNESIGVCQYLLETFPNSIEYHSALTLMNQAGFVGRSDDYAYVDFVSNIFQSYETSFPLILRVNMVANEWLRKDLTLVQSAELFDLVGDHIESSFPKFSHLSDYQWARTSCAYACMRSNQVEQAKQQIQHLNVNEILPQYQVKFSRVNSGIKSHEKLQKQIFVREDQPEKKTSKPSTYSKSKPLMLPAAINFQSGVEPARSRGYSVRDEDKSGEVYESFVYVSLFIVGLGCIVFLGYNPKTEN